MSIEASPFQSDQIKRILKVAGGSLIGAELLRVAFEAKKEGYAYFDRKTGGFMVGVVLHDAEKVAQISGELAGHFWRKTVKIETSNMPDHHLQDLAKLFIEQKRKLKR